MVFVIGGAYQGKLEYVRAQVCAPDASVWACHEQSLEIDWSCQVIDKIHLLVWARQQAGLDTLDYLRQHQSLLQEKIVICDDLSSGWYRLTVIPGSGAKTWGAAPSGWPGKQAVVRVFCGLATELKA
jgi:hypothetical protein